MWDLGQGALPRGAGCRVRGPEERQGARVPAACAADEAMDWMFHVKRWGKLVPQAAVAGRAVRTRSRRVRAAWAGCFT